MIISDAECLKIDLHELKISESAVVEQKRQQKPKLIQVSPDNYALDQINDVEKQELADM